MHRGLSCAGSERVCSLLVVQAWLCLFLKAQSLSSSCPQTQDHHGRLPPSSVRQHLPGHHGGDDLPSGCTALWNVTGDHFTGTGEKQAWLPG